MKDGAQVSPSASNPDSTGQGVVSEYDSECPNFRMRLSYFDYSQPL